MRTHRTKTILTAILIAILSSTAVTAQQPEFNSLFGVPATCESKVPAVYTSAPSAQYRSGFVTVTILVSQYTYPLAISNDGTWICGSYFGGTAGYIWSAATGFQQFPGTYYGITGSGKTTGTFSNPNVTYNGSPVNTAGKFDPAANQWTFLGMNPVSPTTFSSDYNSGWDISYDGTTVVGLQYEPPFVYKAFKWTQAGGYTNLGSGVGNGSRASGISNNGATVYGWAEYPGASRTPVLWYNGQVILINSTQYGEAFGASPNGLYVAGQINNQGFRWSPQGTIFFTNNLWTGDLVPTTVLNNGEVFGYSNTTFPPNPLARKAFARDSTGTLMSFNDYAAARGLPDAQLWQFYSINDASADGNSFIGGAKNPSGQNVTFLMTFVNLPPTLTVTPSSLDFGDILTGTQSEAKILVMKNSGGGNVEVESVALGGLGASQFLLTDNNTYPLNLGYGDSAIVSVRFAPTTSGVKTATVDFSTTGSSFQATLTGKGLPLTGAMEVQAGKPRVSLVPASGQVNVSSSIPLVSVSLINLPGIPVLKAELTASGHATLDVSNIQPGIYIVKVKDSKGETWNSSLIISR